MAFMESYITDKQHWMEVDTTQGIQVIPDDLFSVQDARNLLRREELDKAGLYAMVGEYLECSKAEGIYSASLIRGYGVRLSAAGYMDCTEWEVYGNKREAMRRARELDREEAGQGD